MKHIVISFVSGLAGILCGCWLSGSPQTLPVAHAQTSGRLQIPASPGGEQTQTPVPGRASGGRPQPPHAYTEEGLTPYEAASAYVYESSNRSVVNIATRVAGQRLMWRENPTEDAGSGFVIDRAGHVMTNFHVVEDADRIVVTLFNGQTVTGEAVGVDPLNDIAILRIDVPDDLLEPVVLGDSSQLRVGFQVYAIGNPFGLERTMTTGIISSLNRTLPVTSSRSIKNVIQIDAAINPGNSGGPLLDSHGRLIGMNTAIASSTGQSAGIGFAIPSNLLARVIPELIQHGRVIRPDIGIQQVLKTERGLLILRMDPEGPAARAGLRGPELVRRKRGFVVFEIEDRDQADVIVGVNGRRTEGVDAFLSEVERYRPGDTVTVNILREGQLGGIEVRLAE